MARYSGLYAFEEQAQRYADNISSNFVFGGYDDALPAWRYLDLTEHVEYLARLIDQTLRLDMRNEAALLRAWDSARAAVKYIIEGPDPDIDRIVRSIHGNSGRISNKLRSEFPVLADAAVASDILQAISGAFSG